MARMSLGSTILLLILINEVRPQFFDFLQRFEPVVYGSNVKDITYDVTTRRPRTTTRRTTTRRPAAISFGFDGFERDEATTKKPHRRKQMTTIETFFSNLFSTTPKPVRKTTKANHRAPNTSKAKPNSRITHAASVNEQGTWYDRPVLNNIADDYYARPVYDATTKSNYIQANNYDSRPNSNYDSRPVNYDSNRPNYNTYTTKNPFLNRPGVKPAVAENRPPITNRPPTAVPVTNRPATKRPIFSIARPTDAGSITFPEEDVTPEVISGPDEDYMSAVEKRRYAELAERTCDKYKSQNTKQLQAIPLLPSPDPVQVNVSSCAPTNIPLVVGGKVVTINEFPHMALLGWIKLESGGYAWKCGGSLLSARYVLTAAHCAYQERDNTVISGPPRAVQLGSSYLDDPGALVMKVAAVIKHPKYKSSRSYYDVALVKLLADVSFSEVIRPACLGTPPGVGQPIIATGWGQTKVGGHQSQELRSVSLPIWDLPACARALGTSRKMPDGPSGDSQLCAGDRRGGHDTCQGDSGGPAQIQDGCVWRVVAVTSVGRSCAAPNTPGLYALVQTPFIAAQVFGAQYNQNQNANSQKQNANNQNQNSNSQKQNTNNQNQNTNNRNQYTNDQNQYVNNQNQNQNYNSQKQNANNQNQNSNNRNQYANDQNQYANNQNSNSNNQNEYANNQNQNFNNQNQYVITQNVANEGGRNNRDNTNDYSNQGINQNDNYGRQNNQRNGRREPNYNQNNSQNNQQDNRRSQIDNSRNDYNYNRRDNYGVEDYNVNNQRYNGQRNQYESQPSDYSPNYDSGKFYWTT